MIPLTTNIADVPGVGPRRADAFRRLGIRCVADLVLHLPLRYERELPEQTICEATAAAGAGEVTIAVRGEIASLRVVPARRRRVEAVLQDDSGSLHLTWFNMAWLADKLHAGAFTLYGVDQNDPIVDTARKTAYDYVELNLESQPGDMAVSASISRSRSSAMTMGATIFGKKGRLSSGRIGRRLGKISRARTSRVSSGEGFASPPAVSVTSMSWFIARSSA